MRVCPYCDKAVKRSSSIYKGEFYHQECKYKKIKEDSLPPSKQSKKKVEKPNNEKQWKTCGICGTPKLATGNRPCKRCQYKAHERIRELKGQRPKPKRSTARSTYWSTDGSKLITVNGTGKAPDDTKLRTPVKVYYGGLCMPK